jgi:Leucine-rich repeat (LRR) protein
VLFRSLILSKIKNLISYCHIEEDRNLVELFEDRIADSMPEGCFKNEFQWKTLCLIKWMANSKLKCIELVNKGLTNFSLEVTNFKTLVCLDLSKNNFKEFPSAVCSVKSLEQLFFNSNLIKELPENFGDLVNLKILYLKKNKLSKLPPSFFRLLNLRWVYLNENKFKKIPLQLKLMRDVQYELKGNSIKDGFFKVFCNYYY